MNRPPGLPVGLGGVLVVLLLVPALGHGEEKPSEPALREDPLPGRLFFTQEKRRMLDRMRLGLPVSPPQTTPEEGEATQEATPEPVAAEPVVPRLIAGPRYVSVSGIVRKENGQHIVWVNSQSVPMQKVYEGEGFRAFPERLDERGLPVSAADSERVFHLKSGQTLDLVEGQIRNTYEMDPKVLKTRREPPPEAKSKEGEEKALVKDKGTDMAKTLKEATGVAKQVKEQTGQ